MGVVFRVSLSKDEDLAPSSSANAELRHHGHRPMQTVQTRALASWLPDWTAGPLHEICMGVPETCVRVQGA